MKPDERTGQIDVVRGVAIIGVMLIHSRFEHRFNAPALSIWLFCSVLFDWAVLAFFFLSGLLLDERQPFVEFLKKRFKSLLVPFLFYNLFYNLAFGFLQFSAGKQFSNYQWKPSLLLAGFFHSPAFQLYFLPYLFGISVLLCIFCMFCHARLQWLLLIVGFTVMVAYYQRAGWPESSYGPELIKLPLYFLSFLMGVVGRTVLKQKARMTFVVPFLICVFLALISGQRCLQSLLMPPLFYLVASGVHSIGESKLLREIGRSSGAIYLWHTPIMLPAFTTILALCHVPAMVNLAASVILTIAVCVLLRHVMQEAFERFLKIKTPRSIIP